MEKTAVLAPNKLQKCKWSWSWNNPIGDRISELPDEIIEKILSLLTLKEAVRTSVISSRWKTMWTYYTGNLDLDCSDVVYNINISKQYELLLEERAKYIRFVNQILNSIKSSQIYALTVCFDLSLEFKSDIDRWIKFAIEKRVKRLELDLQRMSKKNYRDCYVFQLQSVWNNSNTAHLTHIDFHYVDVSQQVVEYLLSNCPSLKNLAISVSQSLVGLNVLPESSQKLKQLEIVRCDNLGFLEVEAVNLKSLTYFGHKARICLKNVPKLRELSLGGYYCEDVLWGNYTRSLSFSISRLRELLLDSTAQEHEFEKLNQVHWYNVSIPISQIKKLTLDLTAQSHRFLPELPRFKNLKHLELIVSAKENRPFTSYTFSVLYCSRLTRLSVEMKWREKSVFDVEFDSDNHRETKNKQVRVLELRCFRGNKIDVDLAQNLFKRCPALEKVIVDTRDPRNNETNMIAAKERAWQLLRESFNPGVQFEVL